MLLINVCICSIGWKEGMLFLERCFQEWMLFTRLKLKEIKVELPRARLLLLIVVNSLISQQRYVEDVTVFISIARCNFLCKFLWISYINPYKLDNFFRFFDYLLAISYVNTYKCVAKFFRPDFVIILAPPLIAPAWLLIFYKYVLYVS